MLVLLIALACHKTLHLASFRHHVDIPTYHYQYMGIYRPQRCSMDNYGAPSSLDWPYDS